MLGALIEYRAVKDGGAKRLVISLLYAEIIEK
jgi:hypothetical protein